MISIIIPCYNDEENLRNCLKTIPQDSSIETIIIDDCSDIPITFATYRNQYNQGPGVSRQTGFDMSSGDYIIFMDSDDLFIPEHFKFYLEGIKNNYTIIRDKQYYPYGTIQGICFKREVIENIKFPNDYFFQDIIFLVKALEGQNNIYICPNLWESGENENSITHFKNAYTADALGLFSTSLFVQEQINKDITLSRLKGVLQEKYAQSYPAAGRNAYFFFKSLIDPSIKIDKGRIALLLHSDVEKLFSDEKPSVIKNLHKYIDIAMEL